MKPDILVYALRGRPFGAQHQHNITCALLTGQYVFVMIGSANQPLTFKNPFTSGEVKQMIRGSFNAAANDRIFLFDVEDQATDLMWVTEVQRLVKAQIEHLSFPREPGIALIGHNKDDSSYYLKLFPTWGSVDSGDFRNGMSATDVRNALFNSGDPAHTLNLLEKELEMPKGTFVFLRQWIASHTFKLMQGEFLHHVAENNKFGLHPYNDHHYHLTADYCLFQSGRVLLVRRGEMPGKDLWALPGGHIKVYERFRDAAVRELCEETGVLDLNDWLTQDDLELAIREELLLDDPWRSTRMRTVGMAYGGIIPGTRPLTVEGRDDAHEARMWQINDVTRSIMFEDHFLIIDRFAKKFNIF